MANQPAQDLLFLSRININGHRLRHIPYDLPRYAWVEHNGMGVASWNKAAQL